MNMLHGTWILTSSNLIVRFAGYFYRILMGRMLSPYEFGLLNFALPVQYLAIILTSSGISPTVAKFVSECGDKEHRKQVIISSSLLFYGIGSIIFVAFLYLLAEPISTSLFHDVNAALPLKISLLAIPFGVIIAVYTGVFQGFKKFEYMSITLILEQVFRILFAGVLVYFGASAVYAITGSTLGFVAALPVAFILLRSLGGGFSHYSFREFKRIFLFSLPVSATALAAFVLAYVDVIAIGFYLTPEDAGIYSAAAPTSRLLMAFATAIYAVLLPSVSEMYASENRGEMRKRVFYSYRMFLAVLIPLTVLAVYFSGFIIHVLFPLEGYGSAVLSFKILVVGAAFFGVFTVNSGIFQGLGRPEIPMKVILVAAVLDVFLNIFLVPVYHIEGAAISTSASFIFAGISSTALLRGAI